MPPYQVNGAPLMTDGGAMALDCCCGTASSCTNGEPEILATVTGASGTITWCSETWNLPADSGVQKTICPTAYFRGNGQYATHSLIPYWGRELWSHNGSLYMNEFYKIYKAGTLFWRTANFVTVRHYDPGVGGAGDAFDFVRSSGNAAPRPVGNTYTVLIQNSLGLLNKPLADISYNNYLIRDGMFGSFSSGGITYTWARGAGW